jgi:hypothetical protein
MSNTISISGITGTSFDSAIPSFQSGSVYGYNATYTWRVDSVNQFGTTTGDTWTFTSVNFDPPLASWVNLPGKTLGPEVDGHTYGQGGVPGVDFRWYGINSIGTVKFLLLLKDNSVYYAEAS